MVTVFTVAWSRKNAHAIRFYESDRKELNFAVECGFPVTDRLYFFELTEYKLHLESSRYTDTYNRKKTSVTSHTDICMKAAVSPVRKLL